MRYCPYFCEENIWHLCGDADVPVPIAQRHALFISNAARSVAMRRQRAGDGGVVHWDYHVVLLADRRVWDLDCTLGAPLPLATWLVESFVDDDVRFRVVDAALFRRTFASDRSHMEESGRPLPAWPPIGEGMNLMRFVDMSDGFVGDVVDKAELLRRFG